MSADRSEWVLPPRRADWLGVYIHFPFCIQKCRYCDFYSIGLREASDGAGPVRPDESMLAAFEGRVIEELESRRPAFAQFSAIQSIYFGGGTASLMPPAMIARLIDAIARRFTLIAKCEITVEGNPENFSSTYLRELSAIGVTRVNAGLQTTDRRFLEMMGRYYDDESYDAILDRLSDSPVANIGVDLIYGFPGQRRDDFQADLEHCLHSRINHLSVYSLTVEAGTAYGALRARGKMAPPDEELQNQIFSELPDQLEGAGFVQYEVSNFAFPGGLCRHNLRYWYSEAYLGLGPGAHGFDLHTRYANPRSLQQWLATPVAAGEASVPALDFPISVLRLRQIPAFLWQSRALEDLGLPPGAEECVAAALDRWQAQGLGAFSSGGDFRWSLEGYRQLDDRIAELAGALDSLLVRTESR